MSCVVRGCAAPLGKKAVLCKKHWEAIPQSLRDDLRKGTEKGQHTLRATPSKEWLNAVSKYTSSDVKTLSVKVDEHTNKITRQIEDKPEETPA